MNRQYSFELNKLKDGPNELSFEIDRSFFAEFEHSLVEEGEVSIQAVIEKFKTHLDVVLHLKGVLQLPCDRCTEPYPFDVDTSRRLILAFEKQSKFVNEEVVMIDSNAIWIDLSKEFYDFIHLEVPLRKVPEPEIHLCDDEVLNMLGLKEDEQEADPNPEEKEIDPRWAALKKLKFDQNQ